MIDLTLVFVRNARHDVVSISYDISENDISENDISDKIKSIVRDKAGVGATLYTALYGSIPLAADMYRLDPSLEFIEGPSNV